MDELPTQNDSDQAEQLRRIRHEINNALTGIFGHTQIMQLRGGLDEKIQERVRKIEELAQKIQDLTAQLKKVE